MTPGSFLREKRKSKKLKQLYISSLLGITDERISAWEKDKCLPPTIKLSKLHELYGFDMNEFMEIVRRVA